MTVMENAFMTRKESLVFVKLPIFERKTYTFECLKSMLWHPDMLPLAP